MLFTSKRKIVNKADFELYNCSISNVDSATHLGIKRSINLVQTADKHLDSCIEKSRKAMYGLMASGLHGTNGLDPTTSLHLLNIYIMPRLTYGLDVILLNKGQLSTLERFHKKMLKQILSLPSNTSGSAVYILSGFMPVEAVIHKKILTLFNNVCLQSESSVEKRLARRQLSVKSLDSNSSFINVKKLFFKYCLPELDTILDGTFNKYKWKREVNCKVNIH